MFLAKIPGKRIYAVFHVFTSNVIKVHNLIFCHKYQSKNNFRMKNENINKKLNVDKNDIIKIILYSHESCLFVYCYSSHKSIFVPLYVNIIISLYFKFYEICSFLNILCIVFHIESKFLNLFPIGNLCRINTFFHWRPQFFHWRPQIFIGDLRFLSETPDFH